MDRLDCGSHLLAALEVDEDESGTRDGDGFKDAGGDEEIRGGEGEVLID